MTAVVLRPRAGGKTTALVQQMVFDDRITYVAPTHQQAVMARNVAFDLGIHLPADRFIRAPRDLDRRGPRCDGEVFVVDEADGLLSSLLGGTIMAIALTGEYR